MDKCQLFDMHRPIPQEVNLRLEQIVRDHMPSSILEDEVKLEYLNKTCILCRQTFSRKNELARHLFAAACRSLHGRPPRTLRCRSHRSVVAQATNAFASQPKMVLLSTSTNALLLVHLGEPFQRSLIEMDTRYAAAIQASWEAQMTQDNNTSDGTPANIPTQMGRCQEPQMDTLPLSDISTFEVDSPTMDELQESSIAQDPYLTELALHEQLGDTDGSEEAIFPTLDDITPELLTLQINSCEIVSEDPRYHHWKQVLTEDLSQRAFLLPKISPVHRTLYPTIALKLAGGYYGELFNNSSIVRILSDRCSLCTFVSFNCVDLHLHMNLLHGCLPAWYTSSTAQGGGGSFKIGNL